VETIEIELLMSSLRTGQDELYVIFKDYLEILYSISSTLRKQGIEFDAKPYVPNTDKWYRVKEGTIQKIYVPYSELTMLLEKNNELVNQGNKRNNQLGN
jgi:hypothetical protein